MNKTIDSERRAENVPSIETKRLNQMLAPHEVGFHFGERELHPLVHLHIQSTTNRENG